ncbi:Ig-like domain-containing protein [Pseudomonas sp. MWU13-3659]|uniref:Ig-like domain-containing protein n=1 Tax=Pseudomonas sp. MWU13-3659 TaxID=2986964 RepID=UPI002075F5D2|nr:Ig-like domain-containing protein [Pseudomonas sp. MWU13-3659]
MRTLSKQCLLAGTSDRLRHGLVALLLAMFSPAQVWAALPDPVMTPAPQNGELDPVNIPESGVKVSTVTGGPTYNGQPLTLLLSLANGTVVHKVETQVGLVARPVVLIIPKQAFAGAEGEAVLVRYEVGTQPPSLALSFRVAQGFAGTQTLDLTGKLRLAVYRNGMMVLPEEGPARAPLTFTRQAPGARAYSSLDNSVATVDASGRVTVLRNGQTTITAQLPTGPQSYVLTVTGLRGIEVVANQGSSWNAASQLCASLGAVLPTKVDFEDLKGDYPGRMRSFGLPAYPIWGESLGAGTSLTFDPRTDAVSSETSDANNLRQVACVKT